MHLQLTMIPAPLGSSKAAKYATEDIVTDQPDESSADAALKLRDRLLHTWVSNKELRTLCDDRGLSHAGTNEKLKERLLADGPYAQLSHQELAELCHERGVAPSGNMENRIARLAVYDNLASNFTTSLHSLRTGRLSIPWFKAYLTSPLQLPKTGLPRFLSRRYRL